MKRILLLTALVFVFLLLVFPAFPVFETSGAGMLDTKFFYTPDEARLSLQMLGAKGRSTYFFVAGVVDMIFPLIYGRLFYLAFIALSVRGNFWLRLAWTPAVLDVLENLAILTMLGMYPRFHRAIALTGGLFNGLKWISVIVVLLALVFFFIRNRFFAKESAS